MKPLVLAICIFAFPAAILAQTAAPANAPAKADSKKPVQKPSSEIRRSALKTVEQVTPIDEDPNINLTAEDLEIAKRVFVGTIACELGNSVTLTPSTRRPGFFVVQTKGARFSMHPVESRTGAIRLEDPKRGALWLQLGNKSMLMSQKLGQRLADECMSPEQITLADELKKNPRPGLLDSPAFAANAAPVTAPALTPAVAPAKSSATTK